ncbi:MAG: hypothetical protein WCF36_09650 [Candidatus Nanopelagicales bacterium]
MNGEEDALQRWEEDREKQRQHGDRYGNAVGSTAWHRKRSGMVLVVAGVAGLGTAAIPPALWWLAALSVGAICLGLCIWRKARREYGGSWFE